MPRKPYFKSSPEDPAPLTRTVSRRVRFEEVDALGIVWHGRFPSYAEDARVALYEHYGIGYMEFYRQKVITPIKQMHVDYTKPLRFGEPFTIQGALHYSEAARINFAFCIHDAEQDVCARGYTVQLMLDEEQNLLMAPPEFYLEFLRKWREGALPPAPVKVGTLDGAE